jgi:hypothetical protein
VWDFIKEIKSVWWPHQGQRQFLLVKQPYRALACGRRWGKTDVCAAEVAYRLHRGEEGVTLLIAPTMDQCRILFERVLDLLNALHERWPERFPMPRLRLSPSIRLELNGHRVIARSAHRPRSLRGLGADHIVVDEAAYIPKNLLAEVVFPMLATSKAGTLTLISTPSGFGEFQRFFERGQQGMTRYWSRAAPTAENPQVTRSFLQAMRETTPEATFAREYEGRFAGVENGLFSFEAVRRATEMRPNLAGQGPFVAGLDLVRTRDWTALVVVEGTREIARVVRVERWRRMGWERQLRRVEKILGEYPGVTLHVDKTGLGGPVVEWACESLSGVPIRATIFTTEVKRSMMEGLAVLLEKENLALPEHRELIDELLAFVEKPSGKIEGSGSHDDLVCALALAARELPAACPGMIRLGNRLPG